MKKSMYYIDKNGNLVRRDNKYYKIVIGVYSYDYEKPSLFDDQQFFRTINISKKINN